MTSKRQQNLDIARACGWNRFCAHKVVGKVVDYGHPPKDRCKYETPLLDYLNDLNAMHAAEGVLNECQRTRYRFFLCEILDVKTGADGWRVINATAGQKAEAFLRALELWKA